jgi:hypothetical protein
MELMATDPSHGFVPSDTFERRQFIEKVFGCIDPKKTALFMFIPPSF